MKKTKQLLAMLLALILATGLASCTKKDNASDEKTGAVSTETVSDQTISEAPKTTVNIAYLTGPTGLSMVNLMEDSLDAYNLYNFTGYSAPDEAVAQITSGAADIAAVPTNVAATLYNKTGGKVQILALNTLGVLYVLSNGEDVEKVSDLKGKTLMASGQGSTAEYALGYILTENKLNPGKDVKIEYKAQHAELATLMISGDVKLGMLPEPFVTQVTAKNKDVKVALDLTREWKAVAGDKSDLTMGCLIVRKEFAEQNKDALDHFLDEYKASAGAANADAAATGEYAEKYNVMAADVATAALPKCNITYMDGDAMKTSVSSFLTVLMEANPKSIGGTMPGDDFYYKR